MAVLNKSVDQIAELEELKKHVRTFGGYMRLAQRVFDLRKAFFAELDAIYSLASPSTSTALS